MGRHTARTDLGREFGATDVVPERGEEGVERVRELTGGDGTHVVLECVGLHPAIETAFGVVRDGGTVSRVGAPQYPDVPADFGVFMRNITLTGGVAPARAYIEELLPDILDGRIEPGRVFDHTIGLDEAPGRLPRDGRPHRTEGAHPAMTGTDKTMASWNDDELDRVGDAEELRLASRRPDGVLRRYVTMWVVRSGDNLYVRSAHGPGNPSYRRATAASGQAASSVTSPSPTPPRTSMTASMRRTTPSTTVTGPPSSVPSSAPRPLR